LRNSRRTPYPARNKLERQEGLELEPAPSPVLVETAGDINLFGM